MDKKLLFIHQEKKPRHGSYYINELIINSLRKRGFKIDTIYPSESIEIFSPSLTGIKKILFFYSLITKKIECRNYDIIQGTTYTTLPFLGNDTPVITHFGSTTYGSLRKTPSNNKLKHEKEGLLRVFYELKKALKINEKGTSIKSLRDVRDMEIDVAKRSTAIIATSKKVKKELVKNGVNRKKIKVIHNAIENYWFKTKIVKKAKNDASLVYLGRMGDDTFTVKLKGINRLVYVFEKFSNLDKQIIGMCHKVNEYHTFFSRIPRLNAYLSVKKTEIPHLLKKHYADIYVNCSRYEGFCLSLIEAMSQGLIPIIFSVGIAPEIIKNGYNGYIIKTIDEMISRIDFLNKNKAKRAKMANAAIETSQNFQPKIMVKELESFYSRISHS